MKGIITLLVSLLILSASGQEHYRIAFLVPDPGYKAESPAHLDALLLQSQAHLDSIAQIGELRLSGTLDGGGEILFFHDFIEEHVTDLLHRNPAVTAGYFMVDQYAVSAPIGAICPVKRHADTATYTLISIESSALFRAEPDPVTEEDFRSYLLEPKPDATEIGLLGWFIDSPGSGVLILRNEMTGEVSEWLDASPLMGNPEISYTYRVLRMESTSFCEYF